MKKKLKLLIAASIYPPDPGGPATHAKKQYEWFNENGVRARVVALAWFRFLPKGLSHLFYFLFLLVKGIFCNLIYAHDALGAGAPASWAARILGEKFVIRIGGDIPWEREVGESGKALLEWYENGEHLKSKFFYSSQKVLKKADRLIVTSPLLSRIYTKYYGLPQEKVSVVANPVPELRTAPAEKGNQVVFASRLVSYKNLELAIKALAQVAAARPELKFILMGDGPEEEKLKKLTAELNLKDKVIFKGKVSQNDVLRETAKALFTLAPAVTEFNPNYVLQGLALAKPFIISAGHGLPFETPEFLTFKHDQEKELVDKINYLLTPEGYERAVNFVTSLNFKMSWEDNLGANLKILNEVLNGSK